MKFKFLKKKNNFFFKSITSKKLTNKELNDICFLKDSQWKYGIKSQFKWFKDNIKPYDFHNLFYVNSKLIGYTSLRKRSCKITNLKKKIKYLLFDTFIIHKKCRKLNLSNLFMKYNNFIIEQSGYVSFLVCGNHLVNYYEKNNWTKLNKKNFDVADHPFFSNGMIFNNKKRIIKKHIFYINC